MTVMEGTAYKHALAILELETVRLSKEFPSGTLIEVTNGFNCMKDSVPTNYNLVRLPPGSIGFFRTGLLCCVLEFCAKPGKDYYGKPYIQLKFLNNETGIVYRTKFTGLYADHGDSFQSRFRKVKS